jgi:indole-3-glycerol phosphate synthase
MEPTILQTIADYARQRVAEEKETFDTEYVRSAALSVSKTRRAGAFRNALQGPALSFICEVKKASPSKGVIDPVFDYTKIAADYVDAGADCISCLTEPKWFLGSDKIFMDIRTRCNLPMLRKDFTVDAYQIYEAAVLGANAVLLICSLLDTATIERYLGICDELGLDALVEAHTPEEIASAVAAGAKIIGVNNRNLHDFSVDFSNAARLRDQIPAGTLYVAESGVTSVEDVKALRQIGADAVLMGEVLMRATDRKALLAEMREAAK